MNRKGRERWQGDKGKGEKEVERRGNGKEEGVMYYATMDGS